MISTEVADRLDVSGMVPKQLSNISFAEGTSLWKKQRHFSGFDGHEITTKRYQYFKVGRTLGFETKRYLSQSHGHLFYFNDIQETDYLGYCNLENVYVQWLALKCHRYLLVLSNGSETSLFYFNDPTFWQYQQEEITKYAIQLDFTHKYSILDVIGEGSFSQVHKVHHKDTGQCLAAKVISKIDKKCLPTKSMVASERKILHLMKGQAGVSKFRQFFETDDSFVIILDYVPGINLMTLFNEQRHIPLPRLKEILVDILNIIRECHSRNVIHRDIKPHNIIISPHGSEPKLIDFGLALVTSKEMESHNYYKCGTMGYTAPQVLLTDSMFYKSYGYKCDIFSFGIVAHMLLMGFNPLAGKSEDQLRKNLQIELKQLEIKQRYGDSCLLFLQKLMAANPKQRYTAEQALKSSFLKDCFDQEESTSTLQSGPQNAIETADLS